MKLIIHGGCGSRESSTTDFLSYHKCLSLIVDRAYRYLVDSNNAIETALFAARELEDEPILNAGTGSRLQQDGQIRMSASIMDSVRNKFAAVINIQNIQHPIDVANYLLNEDNSVLCAGEATRYAHNILQLPYYDPLTPQRYAEYLDLKRGLTGTIGVVALDDNKVICSITSTGGAGFETPGRVGDSPTVAGNFASSVMGISCTGIGEQIVNQAIASKVHTRVMDGMTLDHAVNKSIQESDALGYYVGIIAVDGQGKIATGSTKVAQTLYAYCDGVRKKTFYDELR